VDFKKSISSLRFMVREISVWRRLACGEGDKRKYPDPIAVSGKTTGDPSIESPV